MKNYLKLIILLFVLAVFGCSENSNRKEEEKHDKKDLSNREELWGKDRSILRTDYDDSTHREEVLLYMEEEIYTYNTREVAANKLGGCGTSNAMIIGKSGKHFTINGVVTDSLEEDLLALYRKKRRAYLGRTPYYKLHSVNQLRNEINTRYDLIEEEESEAYPSKEYIRSLDTELSILIGYSKALQCVEVDKALFVSEHFHIHIRTRDLDAMKAILSAIYEVRSDISKMYWSLSYAELFQKIESGNPGSIPLDERDMQAIELFVPLQVIDEKQLSKYKDLKDKVVI